MSAKITAVDELGDARAELHSQRIDTSHEIAQNSTVRMFEFVRKPQSRTRRARVSSDETGAVRPFKLPPGVL